MQQDRHKREGSTTQHKRTHTALDTRERQILTLSLEFPNNYSQKCVLWRNMTPPDRHGSPPKIMMTKNLWPSKWEEQAGPPKRLPSSSSGWWQPKPKGLPVFFVTSQSSSHENLPPLVSVFFFFFSSPDPPVFPLFQLRRVPGWAHLSRRFPALLADVKLERKESVSRSFTNISPSLLESAVRVCGGAWEWMRCVRVCAWGSIVVEGGWWAPPRPGRRAGGGGGGGPRGGGGGGGGGGRMVSEANGWERLAEPGEAQHRHSEGEEPTWMRRQSGRRR